MKRTDQVALSRHRILTAAVEEFSQQGYDNASITAMCQRHQLSKGRIYHHFDSKDELYLACAHLCFSSFVQYLEENIPFQEGDIPANCREYFRAREDFFRQNPQLRDLFFVVKFRTPPRLWDRTIQATRCLEEFNSRFSSRLLEKAQLREGFTCKDFQVLVSTLVEGFSHRFSRRLPQDLSPQEAMALHEKMVTRGMDMILRGVLAP